MTIAELDRMLDEQHITEPHIRHMMYQAFVHHHTNHQLLYFASAECCINPDLLEFYRWLYLTGRMHD